MRFWFAPGSDVPLYRQLATQVQLAILSGELRPGDRLPSTRELARRFGIHPNTISAGYRELERERWTELRHGSGVYVCHRTHAPTDDATSLDVHIGNFVRTARQAGFSMSALRTRLGEWLSAPPPDHWVLIDPDNDLRQILLAEMGQHTTAEVRVVTPPDCTPAALAGAIACCRPSQEQTVRAALPAGAELVVLPITSATRWLLPWLPAPQGHLIAVVSCWPEFLSIAKTMLAAAGVPADALVFRHTHEPHWERGLEEMSGVLCDASAAKILKLPARVQIVVFPLLADSAHEILHLPGL